MYHILMEMKTVGPSLNHSLAIVLWDTYGHTPTRLLHMWRWAKSSDAFSMCPWAVDTECARPACKAWDYYYQERASKLMTFKANSYCQGAGAKILAELDPSLISFNNKLWSDVADRSGNGEFSNLSRLNCLIDYHQNCPISPLGPIATNITNFCTRYRASSSRCITNSFRALSWMP